MFSVHFVILLIQVLLSRTNCDIFEPRPPSHFSICGMYEELRICGPSCPMTCDTLKTNVCCDVKCTRGCFCQDGYMLLSDSGPRRCVPIDKCPKPGMLEFGNLTIEVMEGVKMVQIPVVRLEGTAGEVSVQWRTLGDSAKEGRDFVPSSGILVFPDGITLGTISVDIIDDSVREQDERFTVVLSDPTNRAEINPRRMEGVTITIKDDDTRPGYIKVLNNSILVSEGHGSILVPLCRVGGTDGIIRMSYETMDGTAYANVDYVPLRGVLQFSEGEDSKVIEVTIVDDKIRESTESFQVKFSNPTSPTINFRQLSSNLLTVVTIEDDDMTPGYIEAEFPTISVQENAGTVSLPLIRLGGKDGQIKIKYKTVDGTTTKDKDYRPISGEVVFDDGELKKLITLNIIDDNLREPLEENLKIELYDPSAADGVLNFRSLGTKLETTVIIKDDDMNPGTIELPNPVITITESVGTFKLNVVRIGGQDGEIRIRYKTVDGSALSSSDYSFQSGELVFKEGVTLQQIPIIIKNDFLTEPRESFRLEIYDPSVGQDVINFRGLGDRTSTIITIIDDDMRPGYLELEQLNTTIRENQGTLYISVVRLGGTEGILHMKYKTSDGTATSGSDYRPVFGSLSFQDGETKKTIPIFIVNDNQKESIETFNFQIYDIIGGSETINFRSLGSKFSTLVTIIDDDRTPGCVEMETTTISAPESVGAITIPVKRVDGSDGELRVKYLTMDITALGLADYTPTSGVLVFKDREVRQLISIPIINDEEREPLKTFQVQLLDLNPQMSQFPQLGQLNYRTLGNKLKTIVSIIDDDEKPGLIQFEKKHLTIREDVGVAKINLVRVGGTDGILMVKYKAVPGTASGLADFALVQGDLIFQDGVDRLTINIPIVDDRMKEPTEDFSILIFEPAGVQARRLGQITSLDVSITDNDFYPGILEFQKVRISVLESNGIISVTIIRRGGSDGQITIQIRTVGGTATEGIDYNPPSSTVIFPDGVTEQTVQLQILDDSVQEKNEEFFIGIFNPTNGAILGSIKQLTVVIIDDDEPSVIRFQRRSGNYRESAGSIEIPVIREKNLKRRVSAYWKIVDGSAISGTDYRSLSADVVTFNPGETKKSIRIEVLDDTQAENNEFFDVILLQPSEGAVLGVPSRFTVQLLDNDAKVSTPSSVSYGSLPAVSLPSVGVPAVGLPSLGLPQISFRSQNINVKENAGEVLIAITRTCSCALLPISIQIITEDGSAIGGRDYIRVRGPVAFEDGDIEVKIAIKIIDNNGREPDRSFRVLILGPSTGILLGVKVVTVTIQDDDENIYARRDSSSAIASGIRPVPRPPQLDSLGSSILSRPPQRERQPCGIRLCGLGLL